MTVNIIALSYITKQQQQQQQQQQKFSKFSNKWNYSPLHEKNMFEYYNNHHDKRIHVQLERECNFAVMLSSWCMEWFWHISFCLGIYLILKIFSLKFNVQLFNRYFFYKKKVNLLVTQIDHFGSRVNHAWVNPVHDQNSRQSCICVCTWFKIIRRAWSCVRGHFLNSRSRYSRCSRFT